MDAARQLFCIPWRCEDDAPRRQPPLAVYTEADTRVMSPSRKRNPLAADLLADWLASPGAQDLDRETRDRGHEWVSYLRDDGPAPKPDANTNVRGRTHDEQALSSFLRNAYRTLHADRAGRLNELQHTVRDLVALLTNQHGEIQSVREAVHGSLHPIEDALPENEVVKSTAASVRRHLRQLDTAVQQTRSELNERLQSFRTRLLSGVQEALGSDGVVHSEASLAVCYQSLCTAAHLFGENVALATIEVPDAADMRAAAASTRAIFRRTNDVVAVQRGYLVILAIDTPEKHLRRMLTELSQLGAIRVSPHAESFDDLDEAIGSPGPLDVKPAA